MELNRELTLDEKVAYIKAVVEAWWNTKTIKKFVDTIIEEYNLPKDDKLKLAFAFAKWIKQNIRYVPEPPHFNDRIRTPEATLKYQFGDCTEHSILLACVLKYLGIDFNYVLCATNPNQPRTINHIYIEAIINGKRIPLDTTEKYKQLGEEPINFFKLRYK